MLINSTLTRAATQLLCCVVLVSGAFGAEASRASAKPAIVRNADVELLRDRGWVLGAVKNKPLITVRAGDVLIELEGRSAASLGPLQLNWLLNEGFNRPLAALVLRGGQRVRASIFRGDAAPSGPEAALPTLMASAEAPDFRLQELPGGRPVSLRSLRGRWVLLNFWGTYCAPCRIEAPILARLAADERGKLTVLGLDVQDTPQKVRDFLAVNPRSFPILYAGMMKDRLPVSYGVGHPKGGGSVPVSILIAPDGKVVYVQGGYWEPSPLEREVHRFVDDR